MKNQIFRRLLPQEIDCRISTISEKGCSLLLYKDARVDQNILDETFGIYNWQRSHQLIGDRLYCTVSVWDEDKKQWISKQDVGVESYTEKEKGQASDSFKRACFNLGIGRELYTAPFIWIPIDKMNINKKSDGKYYTNDRFYVSDIGYDEAGNITHLVVYKQKPKEKVFTFGAAEEKKDPPKKITKKEADNLRKAISEAQEKWAFKAYGIASLYEMTDEQYGDFTRRLAKNEEAREVEELKKENEKLKEEQGNK